MERIVRNIFLALVIYIFISLRPSSSQVAEIPNPGLQDIAMVTVNNLGQPVIIYNPILCNRVGALICTFYRTHEYGHIALGHSIRRIWPQQMEAEADCWAAKNVSHAVLYAALQWFSSGGGSTPIHGSGTQRAVRLRQCAGVY